MNSVKFAAVLLSLTLRWDGRGGGLSDTIHHNAGCHFNYLLATWPRSTEKPVFHQNLRSRLVISAYLTRKEVDKQHTIDMANANPTQTIFHWLMLELMLGIMGSL